MPSPSSTPAKLPGTRPEGARDEREAAARVQEMFREIVPRYDFLNRLLSLSLDHVWRRRTARKFVHILLRPGARVLDLCCGTGDLTMALDSARAEAQIGEPTRPYPIMGADFVDSMLERARKKSIRNSRRAVFIAADALRLPLGDASVDLVTAAFGFRNLSNYRSGLCEIARVLRSGGEAGVLEFAEPDRGAMSTIFRIYFRHILPRIGRLISGNKTAYSYLPASVSKFPSPMELKQLMESCGFEDVRISKWNFGSVVLHAARRR